MILKLDSYENGSSARTGDSLVWNFSGENIKTNCNVSRSSTSQTDLIETMKMIDRPFVEVVEPKKKMTTNDEHVERKMKEAQNRITAHVYIGETARTLRQRSLEHIKKLKNWGRNSFIIRHWMLEHGSDSTPPEFEFKMVKKFRDSLSRQIAEAILYTGKRYSKSKERIWRKLLMQA